MCTVVHTTWTWFLLIWWSQCLKLVTVMHFCRTFYRFVSGSAAHIKWLAVEKELYPQEKPRELQRRTDVRWACRYMACSRFLDWLIISSAGQKYSDHKSDEGFNRAIRYLDCLTAELEWRFSKKGCEIMQEVRSLDPKSATFLKEPLFAFAQTFESDVKDPNMKRRQVE